MKMKFRKKTLVSLSVILGVALLATSVYADAVSRSAYEQFKDAVKSTSAQMSGQIRNYTQQTTITLKDNGTLLTSRTTVQKVDGRKSETTESTQTQKGTIQSSYNYNDENLNIWYDSYSDVYYVNEYVASEFEEGMKGDYGPVYDAGSYDPLAQEYVSDVERILDAFIGNLKNYLTVDQNADGSKLFDGSLSDTEIPALVNAVASFLTKQYLMSSGNYTAQAIEPVAAGVAGGDVPDARYDPAYGNSRILVPSLDGDVFIKSMTGQARVNPDGLITDVSAIIILSGKDPDGNPHDLTFDFDMTLQSVLTTVVSKPDLTGKTVQVSTVRNENGSNRLSAKYVGTYKNDIVIEQDQSFVKIGERVIVIESISEQGVVGSYSENYSEAPAGTVPLAFDFTAENSDAFGVHFTYTGRHGNRVEGYLYFDPASASIQFYDESDKGAGWFNTTFPRVFD